LRRGSVDGELGAAVAEDREHDGDAGDGIGDDDGGAGGLLGLLVREHEDDGADGEPPDEVPPRERVLHLDAAPAADLMQLRRVQRVIPQRGLSPAAPACTPTSSGTTPPEQIQAAAAAAPRRRAPWKDFSVKQSRVKDFSPIG